MQRLLGRARWDADAVREPSLEEVDDPAGHITATPPVTSIRLSAA